MRFAVQFAAATAVTVALAACSDEPASSRGEDPEASGTDALKAPEEDEGIQLRHAYKGLPAGEEVHYCQYFVLPDRAVDVQRFEHSYTSGGHHVILYPTELTASDVEGRMDVFDCNEVPNRGDVGFGYVGGDTRGSVEYPPSVAYHFEPKSVVLVESHMLNLGQEPLDVDYRVNLVYAQEPVTDHVGTIFFYDNHIVVPELGSSSVQMSCAVPRDIQVLALVPHMHVRGTLFEAWLDPSGAEPRPLLASDDWASTEATRFDPPLAVSPGDRFGFRCEYENPDAVTILEGPSKTESEMCLLIGSYYPRIDFPFEFCLGEESGPVYEGTKTCAETFQCFVGADDSFAADACVLDTCPASGPAFNAFFNCAARECFFPGNCGDDGCAACATERCLDEIQACQVAGCE